VNIQTGFRDETIPGIRLRKVHMNYRDSSVIDSLSFECHGGGVVGLLGKNGAGKSTTMKILCGCIPPTSGDVEVCGLDVLRYPLQAKAKIGYLPEAVSGFNNLTVFEFLSYCASVRGISKAEIRERLNHIVNLFQLGSQMNRAMDRLSKGWRQRAWMAQCLIHDPPVLVLDEPTDGLDPNQKVALRAEIRKLAASKVVLMSTHILEEAEYLCDHILILDAGRKVVDCTIQEALDSSRRLSTMFARATDGLSAV